MAGLCSGTGNKAAPLAERKDDLYETPSVLWADPWGCAMEVIAWAQKGL